ncbi:CheR family methyltransferase [Sphingomonas bacterium]|uniref:CheR family methyltransferase n=1 Tax=Sphingomonas bacterium TaxID=1895847 RepID=UPI0020C65A9E|nr:protein-glutamate O-methyltransferase CheR [Sphingomonas bacterium]
MTGAVTGAMTGAVSPATMQVLTGLLESRTGQQLAAYRSWRLDVALKPVMKARDLPTLDALVDALISCEDLLLADDIVDALVNGETSFFRDAPVFDAVAQAVAAIEAQGRRPRLWSAACATGQEPLSLAMTFADRPPTPAAAPDIVATDVSEGALARARAGRFTQFEVQRGLPIRRLLQWFEGRGDDWVARPELLRAIHFRRLNLVADPAPPGRFDIVLCRNVMLYLAPAQKARVFAMLAGALAPGGLLVLGAGETVIGQTPLFAPSRRFRGLYEKIAEPARVAA